MFAWFGIECDLKRWGRNRVELNLSAFNTLLDGVLREQEGRSKFKIFSCNWSYFRSCCSVWWNVNKGNMPEKLRSVRRSTLLKPFCVIIMLLTYVLSVIIFLRLWLPFLTMLKLDLLSLWIFLFKFVLLTGYMFYTHTLAGDGLMARVVYNASVHLVILSAS